jgi:hypothetical protein
MVVALALAAALSDIQCFEAPEKLVSYLGLNPSVRQPITAGSPSRDMGMPGASFLTILDCATDRIKRGGAPVKNLVHSASFQAVE